METVLVNSPVLGSSLLGPALDLAEAGFPVLPAYPDKKRPRLLDWPNKATTDPDVIHGWWGTWPDSRISVLTGRPAGYVVIDVDPAHGGSESLRALEATYGDLPPTLEVWTGSGGHHLYFQHPGPDVLTRTAVGGLRGVDVRGEGGQVIAPPSLHENGSPYTWELSTNPHPSVMAALPSAWIEFLAAPPIVVPPSESWPAPSLNREPLSESAYRLLREGHRTKKDKSKWVLSLANAAVAAGWNPTDLWSELMKPKNLGGSHLHHWHQARGEADARRRFWMAWDKAQHDSRPGALHVATVRAAILRADWSGRARVTDRALLDALCAMCARAGGDPALSVEQGGTDFHASARDIHLATNVGLGTVAESLRRLRQDGWVKRVKRGGSRGAQVLRLTIPHAYRELNSDSRTDPPLSSHGVGTVQVQTFHIPRGHDVFGHGGLGHLAGRIWGVLRSEDRPWTVREIADAVQQRNAEPVRKALRKLANTSPPLSLRTSRTTYRGVDADLTDVAAFLAVDGRMERAHARVERQRTQYRTAHRVTSDGRPFDPTTGEIEEPF